jgi:hypothetical protein
VSYKLGKKDDGWLVVDTHARRVAAFGGLKLEGLDAEEAEIMLGLMEDYSRGLRREALEWRPEPQAGQAGGRAPAGEG